MFQEKDAPRRKLTPQQLALLQQRLASTGPGTRHAEPGEPPLQARGSEQAPLSFAQHELWMHQQLRPASSVYHIPLALRLHGPLDVAALHHSLQTLIDRHGALRTTICAQGEQVMQRVQPPRPLALPVIDLHALGSAQAQTVACQHLCAREACRPFDLAQGPLLRVTLLRIQAEESLLLLTTHHLIFDGWSTGILLRELAHLYTACTRGTQATLGALPIQYTDYALWQHERASGQMESWLAYWKEQLAGVPALLELPGAAPRPPVRSFRGALYPFSISPALLAGLKALGRQESCTLFMTLLAAWYVLLWRYSGQEDLLVGTPVAGRERAELEGLPGDFINMLPLRARLSDNPTFSDLLRRTRTLVLEAYAHQQAPFARIVEAVLPARTMSAPLLVQVLFVLQSSLAHRTQLGDVVLEYGETHTQTARFDLTVEFRERDQELCGSIEYSSDLFCQERIARMVEHFHLLLEGIVARPGQRVGTFALLCPQEIWLLKEWNATAQTGAGEQCLHRCFERQVALTPDALALCCQEQALTFAGLDARANQLAHYLRARGVGCETLVGLCLERSPEMVVGLLAILKAGAAYVPLDPAFPRERLAFMLSDAHIPLLLTRQPQLAGLPQECVGQSICLDSDWPAIAGAPVTSPQVPVAGEQLCYVIYTSGSTGRPKGVAVTHQAVVNVLASLQQHSGFQRQARLLAVTTLAFDIAALELFLPLVTGAHLEIAGRQVAADGRRLAHLLTTSGATYMQATPVTWRLLLDAGWQGGPQLHVLCGGEAFPRELADRLLQHGCQVWNVYGPTETTIWSTAARVESAEGAIPIGRPLANTRVFLLDQSLQEVPIGVTGEVYIGGRGLARGYLGRPGLTAERFVPDPCGPQAGARLYRTGDLARWRTDGTLECLGRTDGQVKIRGHRIETGEIESVLEEQRAVAQAVVLVHTDRDGQQALAAYIRAQPGQQIDPEEVRAHLRGRLPAYMLPSFLVQLERFPLTPNSKIDRRALPAPVEQARGGRTYIPPRNATEEILEAICREVLHCPPISRDENLFDLGLQSLVAIQLIARVRDRFEVDLPPHRLFDAPDIAQLAEVIGQQLAAQLEMTELEELLVGLD
ncbi:MAG TPA: amino acid adenylation domain-containing protein [Ktedonobacteraceae bacterium]|jgi:amino acid adenylation domain-containing protein